MVVCFIYYTFIMNKLKGMEFSALYEVACKTLQPKQLSKNSYAGGVAAAILTDKGNVYTGVCIDTPCSMGFCAEHAAVAAMITAGENRIVKMVAVTEGNVVVSPCGRCREFICQVHDENDQCEVLLDGNRVVSMKTLIPFRWE